MGMTSTIKFGTDGWRGMIAEDYTFDNVRRVAQAVAAYFREDIGTANQGSVIGYDRRFGSEKFAIAAAELLPGNGTVKAESRDIHRIIRPRFCERGLRQQQRHSFETECKADRGSGRSSESFNQSIVAPTRPYGILGAQISGRHFEGGEVIVIETADEPMVQRIWNLNDIESG